MPLNYVAPLDDMRFLLTRVIGIENFVPMSGNDPMTLDVFEAVLTEASKLAEEVFSPLNYAGDKSGATFANGKVTMPRGFVEAYRAFIEGGWNALPMAPVIGGQGLPTALSLAVQEMFQSANLSLALATLLNQGAIEAISSHGDNALKERFLPKLVSGEWSGTMNLTEPQAGSDVGAVQTKAVRDKEHFLIKGQKIYISYGDHDLCENIVHLVLARLPGAPPGTRGLSLFLVPKFLINEDGSLGLQNDVKTVSIEHKLGQHASPTCVLAYGDEKGAVGYLIGPENGGMAAMFTMMNNARIGVGIQGLALMERAYQDARDQARNRIQGRNLETGAAVAIIDHPDVKRMLLEMKAHVEAARALAYISSLSTDNARHPTDKTSADRAQLRIDLLTPVIKAWLTDGANEVTSLAIQIAGGMGYIEETGVAQHLRDARVLAIYEGTNGIQANDLVFRKIARDKGDACQLLIEDMQQFAGILGSNGTPDLSDLEKAFQSALKDLQLAFAWVKDNVATQKSLTAAGAVPFLRLLAITAGGYYLFIAALKAQEDIAANVGNVDFLRAKLGTAKFYAAHILPQSSYLRTIVIEGGASILEMNASAF